MADRGYVHLLSHLHRPTTTLSLSVIQSSIAHYLAHLQPSPTPLSAAVVSSPLFRPITHEKLLILTTAFRHAVHVKVKLLKEEPRSVFVRSVSARTADWVRAVLQGFVGGHSMMRLVCSGGLLRGLGDLEGELRNRDSSVRREVEEEAIVALAEVIDFYSPVSPSGDWQKDFQHESYEGKELLAMAVALSAEFMTLVAPHRLKALPFPLLSDILMSTISNAFQDGTFLSTAPVSITSTKAGLTIAPTTPLAQTVGTVNSSYIFSSMPSLSKFCGRALSTLMESRPSHGWSAIAKAVREMELLTGKVEADWLRSPFAAITEDDRIDPESLELITTLWNILKTMLFTTIMLLHSILPAVLFVPHPSSSSSNIPSNADGGASPFDIALIVLHTFSHLSFVMPQFGGVTLASEGGLPELKKAFYMALDVLSASPSESDRFVHQLCESFKNEGLACSPPTFMQAKKAYALASVEQLVPVLSEYRIREDVYPLCIPHLSDPSHRETYESAHSVILAIFASQAKQDSDYKYGEETAASFVQQIIPSYVECLMNNADEGKLTTAQLCLAYAAVVRGASSFRPGLEGDTADGDALAWYCIEQLLDVIRQVTTGNHTADRDDHLHRLHLVLVAAVPSVSLVLLPRLLEEVKGIITTYTLSTDNGEPDSSSRSRRMELVQALFKNLSENAGDAEKEFVVRWWEENRDTLGGSRQEVSSDTGRTLVARL